ncbi:hypothetical protein BDR07DRAFT_1406213 [Suillus spraguei]|nr:hypothetical protein BDR07DRAFT_1406213 [Suillus spraguei]
MWVSLSSQQGRDSQSAGAVAKQSENDYFGHHRDYFGTPSLLMVGNGALLTYDIAVAYWRNVRPG